MADPPSKRTSNVGHADGMNDFWRLLKDVQHLFAWALGAAAASIAAGFLSLAPPWPPVVAQITALLELVVLVLVYQYLKDASRRVINLVIAASAISLCISSVMYLAALSQFTFTEPVSNLRFVKGFVCTSDASLLYPKLCPWLNDDQLQEAEWEAPRLWVMWSITIVRVGLVLLWSFSFLALSCLLGSFAVHQRAASSKKI
jgi:hypothetical protein